MPHNPKSYTLFMYFTPSVKIKLFWLLYCYFILKNFQNLVFFLFFFKEGIVAETKARVVLRNKSLKYNCGKGKWAQISIWASLTTKSFLLSMIFCGFFFVKEKCSFTSQMKLTLKLISQLTANVALKHFREDTF